MSVENQEDVKPGEQEEPTPEQIAAQEEADFEAGFNGDDEKPEPPADRPRDEKGRFIKADADEPDGDEPPADDETPDDDEPPADPEPPKKDEPPPEGEEDKISKRLSNVEGHIGGIYNELKRVLTVAEELKAAATASRQTEKAGADAPTSEQVRDALKSGAKMEALKEEFPEWAEAYEEDRDQQISALRQEMSGMVSRSDAEKMAHDAANNAAREARIMARLDARHEGWEDEVQKPEFKAWVEADPDLVVLCNSDDLNDAFSLLDKWKLHVKASVDAANRDAERARNQDRLRRAVPPTDGGTNRLQDRVPSEEEDFEAGFREG